MFQNTTQAYTLADATSEIAIIFFGTLLLGILLGWLLKSSKQIQASSNSKTVSGPKKEDDLQLIEGVGPAIEKLLRKYGVITFKDVIEADVSGLEEILESGGSRFKMHTPTTWPDQARLADTGKWTELEEYQEILNSGK